MFYCYGYDPEECDIEMPLFEEHMRQKEKRRFKRYHDKCKEIDLSTQLQNSAYNPSIWPDGYWDNEDKDYLYNGRVKRAHQSRLQKFYKKYTSHIVRKLPLDTLPPKGNHYRRHFDYWWTLI